MKIVICGAGRVGMSISEHLSTENNDITVIDSNTDALKKITELYDVQGVLGLSSHPAVLKNAGGSLTRLNNDELSYGGSNFEQGGIIVATSDKFSHKSICSEIMIIIRKFDLYPFD